MNKDEILHFTAWSNSYKLKCLRQENKGFDT